MTDEQKMMPCPVEIPDDVLDDILKKTGEWCVPYIAPRECGVPVDGDISQEDADTINDEMRKGYREFFAIALPALTAWNKRLPPEGGEAKPVAWRWRPKGSTLWIYDPEEEWLNSQGCEIDREPLYAHSARAILSFDTGGDGAYDSQCLITEERIDRAQTCLEHEGVTDADPIARAVLNSDDHFVRALIRGAYERGVNDMREACAKLFDWRAAAIKRRIDKYAPSDFHPDQPYYEAALGDAEIIRALPSPATISTGSAPEPSAFDQHDWQEMTFGKKSGLTLTCCTKCGYVRRADGKPNKPCKGRLAVVVREPQS